MHNTNTFAKAAVEVHPIVKVATLMPLQEPSLAKWLQCH